MKKKPYQDLTGQKFGRLLVLSLVDDEAGADKPTKWVCECECGERLIVLGYNLKSGNTKSCGCLQKDLAREAQKKHNKTGTRLYTTWEHMKQRCINPHNRAYKHYGGRGIAVCQEWKNDFKTFYDWALSNGYADNLTIDRIDVNGNYSPENCRWITLKEQQVNKRDNTRITFQGKSKTISEWAKEFDCYNSAVYREILKREGRLQNESY